MAEYWILEGYEDEDGERSLEVAQLDPDDEDNLVPAPKGREDGRWTEEDVLEAVRSDSDDIYTTLRRKPRYGHEERRYGRGQKVMYVLKTPGNSDTADNYNQMFERNKMSEREAAMVRNIVERYMKEDS